MKSKLKSGNVKHLSQKEIDELRKDKIRSSEILKRLLNEKNQPKRFGMGK